MRPFLIAIAGGSGAGKSTLADLLARRFAEAGRPAVLIAEDDYYLPAGDMPDFDPATVNFDEPASKDHALLLADLTALRAGKPIDKPIYDFARHTRRAETQRIAPADVVIIEGLFALAHEKLRPVYDLAVFVDAPEHFRLSLRLVRDVKERGRTEDFARRQFATHTAPMHVLHVQPQAAYADLAFAVLPERGVGQLGGFAEEIAAEALRRQQQSRA